MRELAKARGAKPGQIALAWLLHKGGHRAHPRHQAPDLPGRERGRRHRPLEPAQMQVFDEAMAPGKVSGQRYADWIMATIDR